MITTQSLAKAYGRNVAIIQEQTAGLSHADSLLQLPFRANCLNWVIGHLLTNRLTVFRLLGVEHLPFDPAILDRYQRESQPILEDGEGVLPLEKLLAMLEQSQGLLAERMASLSADELERPLDLFGGRAQALADWLFFFYFHDCYHTGQTEILRQAAGTDDKII